MEKIQDSDDSELKHVKSEDQQFILRSAIIHKHLDKIMFQTSIGEL